MKSDMLSRRNEREKTDRVAHEMIKVVSVEDRENDSGFGNENGASGIETELATETSRARDAEQTFVFETGHAPYVR